MKASKPISIYFMVPSPLGTAPGQRFRFEHYLSLLKDKGIGYKVGSYFSAKERKKLYSKKHTWTKVLVVLKGYAKRVCQMFLIWRYDYIYIHKESAPLGPPVFPWIITKVLRKKLIYDFDDAIWLGVISKYNRKFFFLKHSNKVPMICRWSYKVTVGNTYLKEFASRHNANVFVIPTVVNTETAHNVLQDQDTEHPAIGWTGSFSTLKYLKLIFPVLQKLQEEIDFTFYVIADKDPRLPLKNYAFIQWQKETEIQDLLRFHIGIMPLSDDEFSKGKCGFKAIQYMSLGIPAVVSPVGVNAEIVDDELNGFVCSSESDWEEKLRQLLTNAPLRKRIGKSARSKIEDQYSVKATEQLFLNLFTPEAIKRSV